MKKLQIIAFLLLGLIAFNVSGQISVGATIGAQLPMGDFSDIAKTGFGFNAMGTYSLDDNMAVGLNIGYNQFGKVEIPFFEETETITYSMIPITGLFHYYFSNGTLRPFAGADLGLYSMGAKVKFMGVETSDSKTYFGFAPTVGAMYELNDDVFLCGNLKYHYVSSEDIASTWVGINVGAVIKISK
jgi:outer membrane protein W